MLAVIAFITFAVFLSAVIRQISGFGFALVAMPLVTMILGIRVATPFVAIAATTVGLIMIYSNWREADRTKLRATTRAAVLCIEALPPTPRGVVHDACTDLASLVMRELGGIADIRILDRTTPTASFPSGT